MIEFFTLLTDIGLSKLTNSAINGVAVDLRSIAIGDGSGDYYEPTPSQRELENEVFRADLNALIIDPADSKRFSAQIIVPESSGGYTIREAGLFDADNDLIAVAKVPATFKPDNDSGAGAQIYFKILIECSEKANVTISITPSDLFITQEVLDVHLNDKTNPHAVTKAQVGLGKASDTSDEDKPISKATQNALNAKQPTGDYAMNAALNAHTTIKTNPHAVTKGQIELGNVDNIKQYSANFTPPYPVTSVAGKTGAVTLTTDDIISGILPIEKGGTNSSTLAGTNSLTQQLFPTSIVNPKNVAVIGEASWANNGYTSIANLASTLGVNNKQDKLVFPLGTAQGGTGRADGKTFGFLSNNNVYFNMPSGSQETTSDCSHIAGTKGGAEYYWFTTNALKASMALNNVNNTADSDKIVKGIYERGARWGGWYKLHLGKGDGNESYRHHLYASNPSFPDMDSISVARATVAGAANTLGSSNVIATSIGPLYSLPAGGTWAWHYVFFVGVAINANSGVSAGGSQITGGVTLAYLIAFRIS